MENIKSIKPSLCDIPKIEGNYHKVDPFITQFNQQEYARNKWGDEYRAQVQTLWEQAINCYKEDQEFIRNWQEYILIITFDYYIGPYIGLPEKEKIQFYSWIFKYLSTALPSE